MFESAKIFESIIFFLIIVPGLLFALRGSSYIVDYTILVFVFNREIRRMVDYSNHQFNAFSLISLTPLLMLGLLFTAFVWNFKMLHRNVQQIFVLMLAAVGYGMIIGLWRNGVASIYQGAQYLSTLGLMGYVAISPANDETADRWLRTAGFAGVLAALYGWYQYLVVPDWDAFWVQQVGFVGYLGQLEPTKMTVFSTFAERGVCALYLALVAIPMLVSKRWRVAFGLPEVLLLLSCIFLTYSRSGIIVVLLGAVLYPILNGGKNTGRIVIICALVVAVLFVSASKIPGADRITTRFQSLLHMQDDGSFKGRLQIAQVSWPNVIQNPAGFGIGSSGLAGRLNGGGAAVITDNGWLEMMMSLGIPGFLLFASGLALIWRYFSLLGRFGIQDDYLGLARTFFVAALVFNWTNNFFIEFTVMWIAFGRALSPAMFAKIHPEILEIVDGQTAEATS
jgi:putative inorganic carbon (hco3(-)) transporter